MSLGPAALATYVAPAAPSWSSLFGGWSLDPLFALTVVAGVLYLSGVRRLAARGRMWPRARSVAFGAGLAVLVVATQSGFAQYDRTLFSYHVGQHVLLGMVAPLLLVLGAPVTLALQASNRTAQRRMLRVLHSRPITVCTHPATVWVLFGATLVVLYFTGLYELSLRNDAVHVLVHGHFVVVGALFMGYVVGVDPLAVRLGYGARALYVFLLLPFHTFLGVAILGSDQVLASGWYSTVVRTWGPTPLDDQRVGAGILWAAGELVGVVALVIVAYQWMRHEERVGARLDRRLDADGSSSLTAAQDTCAAGVRSAAPTLAPLASAAPTLAPLASDADGSSSLTANAWHTATRH